MMITLWLTLVDGSDDRIGIDTNLWVRTLETGCVPLVTDDIILWRTEEEGAQGGPLWSIKRRFMDAAGQWHIELTRVIVDPSEAVKTRIQRQVVSGDRYERPWYTGSRGGPSELERCLRAGGWVPYDEFATRNEEEDPT